MVNYRQVLCEVALLCALIAVTNAAPAPDCTQNHYDQRQNGSENYRLNIDGVVVAVAPAESLLSALGDVDDLMDLLAIEDFHGDYKPKPPSTSSPLSSFESEKPIEQKPVEEKPLVQKPVEEKPAEEKPQEVKPEEPKPSAPTKPADLSPLSDVSLNDDVNIQKKEVSTKKQEKATRLKNRLAAFLMPLLRKTRHQ